MKVNWIRLIGSLSIGALALTGCKSKEKEPEPTKEEKKAADEPVDKTGESKTGENKCPSGENKCPSGENKCPSGENKCPSGEGK